jgi:hypothetical protein
LWNVKCVTLIYFRFDPLDKNEIAAEIEDDIYCRRISEAERKLEILKNTTAVDQIAER